MQRHSINQIIYWLNFIRFSSIPHQKACFPLRGMPTLLAIGGATIDGVPHGAPRIPSRSIVVTWHSIPSRIIVVTWHSVAPLSSILFLFSSIVLVNRENSCQSFSSAIHDNFTVATRDFFAAMELWAQEMNISIRFVLITKIMCKITDKKKSQI